MAPPPPEARPAVRAGHENWLLAALPKRAYARIIDQCEIIPLVTKDVVVQPDVPFAHAHFPRSGCLSIVSTMADGGKVEVGTIGWEGMSGISMLHAVRSVSTMCVVQVDGDAARLPVDAFSAELKNHNELRGVLQRYAQVWIETISRNSACNAVHSVDERLARWLLLTRDRVDDDLLPLTQEFLATMLGVRRASVTVAASALQHAGLIDYKYGKIVVLDRIGLEAASCECYALTRAIYGKLLPVSPARADA